MDFETASGGGVPEAVTSIAHSHEVATGFVASKAEGCVIKFAPHKALQSIA